MVRGRGPLAVFVHGGGLDHTMWSGQLEALADLRTCVAIDLPGHGQSPAGRFELAELLDEFGEAEADLVGHSWGGHEVLRCWWRSPATVRSIALLGVMFSADAGVRPGPADRPVPIPFQDGVVRSIDVPLLVATGVDDTNTPPDLCQKLAFANPRARWVTFPNAGHMSPVEQPAAVSGALRKLWYDFGAERRSATRNTGEAYQLGAEPDL